jgi:hypothetical protein
MIEITRGYRSGRDVGEARGRRPPDPLLKAILMDMLITTTGFVMIVVAVLLTMQCLSLK